MVKNMDTIVQLAKHRGFVFPGSDIYGGLSNTWDYGPLGVELKNNIKKAWWQKFITQSPYNVGIDAAILMNPKTWEASGHLGNFNDPMIDNKDSKIRYRADKLIEDYMQNEKGDENFIADGLSFDEMKKLLMMKELFVRSVRLQTGLISVNLILCSRLSKVLLKILLMNYFYDLKQLKVFL